MNAMMLGPRHPCPSCKSSAVGVTPPPPAQDEILELRIRIAELEDELKRLNAGNALTSVCDRQQMLETLKANENRLRQSELFDREIVSGAREGIVVYDRELRYQVWNPFMEELTGMPASRVLGKDALELFPHLRQESLDKLLARALAGETVQSPDVCYQVSESGRTGWVSSIFSPHLGTDGDVVGVIGLIRDITARRQAEEAAERNRAELQAVYDNAPMLLLLLDEEGKIRKANAAAAIDSTNQLIGMPLCAAVRCANCLADPAPCGTDAGCRDCPIHLAVDGTLKTGESHRNVEASILVRSRGTEENLTFLVSTTKTVLDKQAVVLASLTDVTGRKRTQEALRESAAELAAAQRIAHIGSWQWNVPMDTLRWSDETFRILGLAPGALKPDRDRFFDLVHPDDRERVRQVLAGVLEGSMQCDLEHRVLLPGGSEKVVHLQAEVLRGEAGEAVRVQGTVRDITDRKKAEEALQLSEERQRLALETARAGLWDWDVTRDAAYVSPQCEAVLGYEPGELTDSREWWKAMVQREDLERTLEAVAERADDSIEPFSAEYRIRHKSGRSIWVAAHARVVSRSSDGRPLRVMGTLSDITERRTVQEQLAQAQKLESVGRLAGGIAHDFNNLLTVINGYGDLLMRELKEGDPLRAWAVEIRSAGERAASVTSQLLTFSRKQVGDPRPMDLNKLINEHRAMFQRLIGEDIDLVVQVEETPAVVMADPVQIHRVIMNLVVNAVDAMSSGGTLTVRTANVELDGIPVGHAGLRAGPFVVLEVSDTGLGIEKEIQERIFEPFFTTKGFGEGTGLGLSTVYGIVRQCGGSIAVRSEPGHGATFEVLLPRAEAPAVTEDATAAPSRAPLGSETILVVEDQEMVRKVAVASLKSRGYRIVAASHGGEALLLAERHQGPIHLMLTDVVMPHMTGVELAERLRPLRPEMKVLYMSGYAEDVVARRGLREARAPYLAKPFTPDRLASKVREVLGPVRRAFGILVVDDEESVRHFFRQVLADAGYEVVLAKDGGEALEQARKRHFDLVLMDLVMPEREGIETIDTLRKEQPDLKIVAVSGAFGGKFLKVAHALGAHATLMKPVPPEQLLALVRSLTR